MGFDQKHVRVRCVVACLSKAQLTPASWQAGYRRAGSPHRKLEMLDARCGASNGLDQLCYDACAMG